MQHATSSRVAGHYGAPGLEERIEQALNAAGLVAGPVDPAALAPLDQFHTGGVAATLTLAARVPINRDTRVLDVGGGIGGAARTLASAFGCRVTVIDLTEAYARIGERLTRLTGLESRVTWEVGDAVATPFDDGAFDLVWTQHSTMNIPDKAALYRELHRVLRPGGWLAMHEITAGSGGPVYFPVPWASTAGESFLLLPDELARIIESAGFARREWEDLSAESVAWFRERGAASAGAPRPPLGLHVLMGERFGAAFQNQFRNLEEGRAAIVRGIWQKPA